MTGAMDMMHRRMLEMEAEQQRQGCERRRYRFHRRAEQSQMGDEGVPHPR